MKWLPTLLLLLALPARAAELHGMPEQGGLVFGRTEPGARVTLDGRAVRVGTDGRFVFGFGRDAGPKAVLEIATAAGSERRELAVAPRPWDVQRIDGLPEAQVTPPPVLLERIRREGAAIAAVRTRNTPEPWFTAGFVWPAEGRVSGVYGSQRILNGQPRAPHFGIDIAAPTGTPVVATTPGVVTLAETDIYFTGGTVIIDHGFGLNGAYSHLHTVEVKVGDAVKQGQRIGTVGSTGRSTGPHLDFRLNWFDVRVDPQKVLPPR